MKRSRTSKAWMREHVNDPFVKKAKAEGYRSRAAYKLLEIDDKDHLLRPGMLVLDLGAAPGGWSQVAAERMGPQGRVVAVDLLEMPPLPGVEFLCGDFREQELLDRLFELLNGRRPDLVIADMAPNISGVDSVDQARCMYLCELALDFARTQLQPNGSFLVKVFQGEGFTEFYRTLRTVFCNVYTRKPKASRDRSNETYLLARVLRVTPSELI